MNLTGIIRIQEKVAGSNDFTVEEIDFILDAISAAILARGRLEFTKAGVIDWKLEAERANRLLSAIPVTPSCGCIFCDLDIELHEDEQGFHHVIKGERIACTLVKEDDCSCGGGDLSGHDALCPHAAVKP